MISPHELIAAAVSAALHAPAHPRRHRRGCDRRVAIATALRAWPRVRAELIARVREL